MTEPLRNQRGNKNPLPNATKVAGFFIARKESRMSTYEFYMVQKEICLLRSKLMSDANVKKFWKNAADGYSAKLDKLTIAEAERE